MADPKQILFGILSATLSSVQQERANAEQQLKSLENQPGYGVALAQIVQDNKLPIAIRQLSGIVLKRFVKEHWDQEASESQTPIYIPPVEDKNVIKSILAQGLSDPDPKLRTAVAMAIGSIASWDWPDQWPRFLEDLVTALHSTDLNLVNGAIRCLDIFLDKDAVDDTHLGTLIKVLFPEMWRIFSDAQYSDKIKMKAVSVIHSLVQWLGITKDEPNTKANLKIFFQTAIAPWFQGFAKVLSVPDSVTSDSGLKINIMKVLLIFVQEFPSYVKPYVPGVMDPVWNSLVNGIAIYEKAAVLENTLENTVQDEDGDVLGFETLVQFFWEFIHSILEKKALKSLLKSNIPGLIYVAIGYMQITAEQEDTWEHDSNEYVASEEDVLNNYNVRTSALSLITYIVEEFEDEAFKGLVAAVHKRIEESGKMKEQNNVLWWKLREAALYAIGSSTDSAEEFSESLNSAQFINNALIQDINTDIMFLRSRVLACASKFAKIVPVDYSLPFLVTACTILTDANAPFLLKIGAIKAVGSFCPNLSKEVILPYLPTILTGATALINEATEDTLHLILDTLYVSSKVDPVITAKYEATITPYVLSVWSKHSNDPMMTTIVMDLLEVLANCPDCFPQVYTRLLEVASTILNNSAELPGLTEASVGILNILVKAAPVPLPEPLLVKGFPLVIKHMMNSEDYGILQEGATCLTSYVRKGAPQLVAWKPDGNTPALQYIIQAVARLLNPSIGDPAAIFVGNLIAKLLAVVPDHIGPFLGDMLTAIVNRLEIAELPSLIQPLVLIFARLFHTHVNQVMSFLGGVTTNKGANGLVFVMNAWTKHHEEFQGSYYLKLSCTGLAKVLELQDSRLDSISVTGDVVVDPQEGIITRSKSKTTEKRFSLVPLKVKILSLLVREHQIANVAEEEENDEEDDELDEEDEDDFLKSEYAKTLGITGASGPFLSASALFGEEDWEDDDDFEDPDVQNDPINQLVLKDYLGDFLRNLARTDTNGMLALGKQLAPSDQQILQAIVTGNK